MTLKKLVLLIVILSIAGYGLAQETKPTLEQTVLKELSDKTCKCIDSIQTVNKKKADIAQEIGDCIDKYADSYQLMAKTFALTNIDSAITSKTDDNNKKVNVEIRIDMNKNSPEYKKYYYELERYLMDNCAAVKAKVANDDQIKDVSLSENKEAMKWYHKGDDELKEKNYQKAVEMYEKALKIDAKFAFAWDNLGISYRMLGKYDKALEAYQKSLALDPKGLFPLQNIPVVYIYKKEYQKAIDAYEKLALVDDKNPEVYYGIGNIYASELQEYEKALPNLCKAYNLYIEQKSPYRTDAEKLINVVYAGMKKQGKTKQFSEILKKYNISNN